MIGNFRSQQFEKFLYFSFEFATDFKILYTKMVKKEARPLTFLQNKTVKDGAGPLKILHNKMVKKRPDLSKFFTRK